MTNQDCSINSAMRRLVATTFFLLVLTAAITHAQTFNSTEDHYARGVAKYEKGDFDGAIAEFNQVIEASLNDVSLFAQPAGAKRASDANLVIAYDDLVLVVPRAA